MSAKGQTRDLGMNKTEAAYAQHLYLRQLAGEIKWYMPWGWKFRLAAGAYYLPDFVVMDKDDNLEVHEVKGFWREAARVRIKVAAELHPVKFVAVTKTKAGWEIEEF